MRNLSHILHRHVVSFLNVYAYDSCSCLFLKILLNKHDIYVDSLSYEDEHADGDFQSQQRHDYNDCTVK